MKFRFFIYLIIIMVTACSGHHDEIASTKTDPEETIFDLPDSIITSEKVDGT
ncbi:MAG: hypothetical protein K2I08_00245 [Muribaculaceae bacterium]|nr:hypothetical protein [Muribaculaceae bacterium]